MKKVYLLHLFILIFILTFVLIQTKINSQWICQPPDPVYSSHVSVDPPSFSWTPVSNPVWCYGVVGKWEILCPYPPFGTGIIFFSAGTTDSFYIMPNSTWATFNAGQQYCWALESGTFAQRYAPGGSFTRVQAALQNTALLYPTNGASNVELTTIFRWNKIDSANNYIIRIYDSKRLNNVIYEYYSHSDSLRLPLGWIQNSRTYWWRVKPYSTGGEGPISDASIFSTIAASQVPAPSLLLPAYGSIGSKLNPALDWMDVSGAVNYRVQLSTESSFNSLVIDDNTITNSQYMVPANLLSGNTIYYWRVASKGSTEWSPFSVIWNFKTVGIPLQVNLFSPPNNSVFQPLNLTFTWYKALETLSRFSDTISTALIPETISNNYDAISAYWFELTTDTVLYTGLIRDTLLTDTTKTVNGLNNATLYYWRVKAKNDAGTGSFSPWWKFSTPTVPAKVVLSIPQNNAAEQLTNLSFSWYNREIASKFNSNSGKITTERASQTDAINFYWFEIVTDTILNAGLIRDTLLTDTSKIINGLNFSTAYYWHVKAHNQLGWGAFSDWWKLTTTNGSPVLISPADYQTEIPVTPLLDWSDVPNAVKYRVQVSSNINFTSLTIDDSSNTESQYQVQPGIISYNSSYYWRVKTKNQNSWGDYQTPFRFFTMVSAPFPSPVLLYPDTNAVDVSITPVLDWNDVPGYTAYKLQVSTVPNFNTLIINDSSLITSDYAVPPGYLLGNSVYYWKVAAKGTGSWGSFSIPRNFRTLAVPSPVVLSIPPDNSTEQNVNLRLSWYKAAETLSKQYYSDNSKTSLPERSQISDIFKTNKDFVSNYWFELVADTSTFSGLIKDSLLTDTSKVVIGLNSFTRYYWRVKAKNEKGWGPYSSWWKFTTLSNITWNPQVSGISTDLYSIYFIDDIKGWACGQNGIILNTTNGGVNWSQQSSGTGAMLYEINFVNENTGWAAGESASILKTTNGGVNWLNLTAPPASSWFKSISFLNANTGFVTGIHAQYNDIYKTINGGLNWITVANSISPGLYEISYPRVSPYSSVFICGIVFDGSSHGSITSSTNEGVDWTTTINGTGGHLLRSTCFINSQTGWSVGDAGSIIYTSNGGSSFTIQSSPLFSVFYSVHFTDQNTGYAVGSGGSIISTYNGGLNWLINNSGTGVVLRSVHMSSANNGWIAGDGGTILKSTSNTQTISRPDLLSPASGSVGLTLSPLLDWTDVISAVKYRVQISKHVNFDTTQVDDSLLSISQFTVPVNILTGNSVYYWRASASDGTNWSSFSAIWNFRTDSVPAPVALALPVNNAINQYDNLIFTWNRINTSASKFKNNASAQYISSVFSTYNVLTIKNNIDAVDKYWFELTADTNTFSGLIRDSLLADTSKTVTGLFYSASYYWRVKAHNEIGWGQFSSWWKFTTTTGAPVLEIPVNNQTEVAVTPLLNWSDIPNFAKYRLQVSALSNFSVLWIDDSNLTNSQYQVIKGVLAYNSLYYWRVKTKNSAGWGDYQTPIRFFTMITPPPVEPVLLSPSNGSTGIALTPILDWSDISGGTKYRVQISADTAFTSLITDDSTLLISQYSVPAGLLNGNTKYYWRAAAKGSSSWSAFSALWNFTTAGVPLPVVLVFPPDNSTEQSIDMIFRWNKAVELLSKKLSKVTTDISPNKNSLVKRNTDAINAYWFEMTTDTNTFAGLIKDSTLTDTLKTINALTVNTKYYWRVKAKNASGWGLFSLWWKFTTVSNLPPAPPALVTPANNAQNIAVTPLLDWNDATDSTKYRLQVSALSSFSVLWIDDSNITNSQYQVLGGILAYNSAYYWRVKAKNSAGWGNYQASPYRFFTYLSPPPAIPVLVLPLNGATGVSLTPLLDWNDVSGITKYRLQIATDTGFTNKITDDSTIITSQYNVPAGLLANNVYYYWRVASKNTMYWSTFSAAFSFKTFGNPQNVILLSPANNSIEQSLNITFLWKKAIETLDKPDTKIQLSGKANGNKLFGENDGTDAISNYWFELVNDTLTLAGLIKDTTLTDTLKNVTSLTANTVYYWRAKAKNEVGWGPYSAWWKFTTVTGLPPSPPVLIYPANRAADIVVTPLLDWNDVSGAQKYRVQVSAFSNFSTLWIDDSSSTVSEFQVPGGILAYNSGYFWRVKAKNDAGWGNYQTVLFRFFTLVSPPQAPPSLVSPANSAVNVSLTPLLDWSDISGAVKYRVQVSTSSGFASLIIDDSNSVLSQFTIPAGILNYSTLYYWRVSVKTGTVWSAFSGAWSFTTVTALSPPVLLSPVNKDTGVVVTTLFNWSKVTGATSYRLQASAFSNFSVLWIDKYVSDSSYQTPNGVLAYNSRYFWRVKSLRAGDSSSFSNVNYFFTKIFAYGADKPDFEEFKILDLRGLFTDVKKGNYSIQVCKDTMFENIIIKLENVKGDSVVLPITTLDEYSTYFWRVTSGNLKQSNYQTQVFVTYKTKQSELMSLMQNSVIPEKYSLYQNYPNPFNPVCRIKFDIPMTSNEITDHVKLIVYDLLGREVAILVNSELIPGVYEIQWNASDYPSGIYIYQLKTNRFSDTKKMVLIK